VPEADAKAYYDGHPEEFKRSDEVKLRMILVEVPADADAKAQAAAQAKLDKALQRVKAGEDFAKVAAEVSDDATKAQGGDVGWVGKGRLLREVEEPVFALKKGDVSGILKTKFGLNVFRVEDRRGPRTQSFDEVKSGLTQFLKSNRVQIKVRELVAGLRAKAKVEILDATLKASVDAAPAPPAAGTGK
jgi:parvulin-like peptidyl-prolyl isomerase